MSLVNGLTEQGLSFSRPVTTQAGEIVYILIESENPCYCYLIAQDSERNLIILNNGKLQGNTILKVGPVEILPPTGTESFYVVMSALPRTNLETQIRSFSKRQKSQRTTNNVMDEIFNIRREVSSLQENPEKAVLMGGTFRGEEQKPVEGTHYSGAGAYVKTIVIRH
jgi:hypothetical protein